MTSSPSCNFCGKDKHQVKKLLAGNESTHICNLCVDLCWHILNDDTTEEGKEISKARKATKRIPPKELHSYLNKHVIGQDNAKKSISVAVYNHYKRITSKAKVNIGKSNILITGPTGCGKTLIAQTLAQQLKVPMVITDATVITESGYAGDDAEVLIHKLVQDANYDLDKASIGIIYVDEIDKKAKRNDMVSLSRDVSGEGVQQSLLKLMEGTIVSIPNQPNHNPERIDIDTKDILFIVAGAFVGLDETVLQRIGKNKIGFQDGEATLVTNWEEHLQTTDFVKYGLIPEFVGRLPSINTLHELSKDDLIRILTEPENNIVSQYKELFKMDNVEIEFSKKALDAVATVAIEQKLGARGLRKILDRALIDIQYELPDLSERGVTKIVITDQTIKDDMPPLLVKG